MILPGGVYSSCSVSSSEQKADANDPANFQVGRYGIFGKFFTFLLSSNSKEKEKNELRY